MWGGYYMSLCHNDDNLTFAYTSYIRFMAITIVFTPNDQITWETRVTTWGVLRARCPRSHWGLAEDPPRGFSLNLGVKEPGEQGRRRESQGQAQLGRSAWSLSPALSSDRQHERDLVRAPGTWCGASQSERRTAGVRPIRANVSVVWSLGVQAFISCLLSAVLLDSMSKQNILPSTFTSKSYRRAKMWGSNFHRNSSSLWLCFCHRLRETLLHISQFHFTNVYQN